MPPLAIPQGMPMPGGPPRGPANVGPISSPQPQAGNAAAGHQKLMIALSALQDALPSLPMGSKLHTTALKVTEQLTRELQEAKEDPQLQIQALVGMIRQLAQNPQNQMLSRLAAPNAPPQMGAPSPEAPPQAEAA